MLRIAREQFHYLKESSARLEFAVADARLSLERESPQQFDLLAIDAFSGDAIPRICSRRKRWICTCGTSSPMARSFSSPTAI